MNNWLGISLFVLSFCLSPTYPIKIETSKNLSQESRCDVQNSTFQAGEELVYKVYYNWGLIWLSAGEVVFKVEDLCSDYKISARGYTYKSYEWFFKVQDYYETIIDKQTLLPKRFTRDVREGKFTMYNQVKFNQNINTCESTKGKNKDEAQAKTFEIEQCMHDVLSAIYYTRNYNFSQMDNGEKFPVKVFLDDENWKLNVKFVGLKMKKDIKELGKYNTFHFSPQVVKGSVFKESDQLNLFVSNDKNKIPLLIESPVSVGSIKVILKNYKGLKFPLEAKCQ